MNLTFIKISEHTEALTLICNNNNNNTDIYLVSLLICEYLRVQIYMKN